MLWFAHLLLFPSSFFSLDYISLVLTFWNRNIEFYTIFSLQCDVRQSIPQNDWIFFFFSHYIINFQGEKKYSFQYLFSNWMWLMLAMYWIFVYISWYDHPNGANFFFSPSLQHWLCVRKTPTDTLKIYCNRLLNIY